MSGPALPKRIHRYRILSELGRGSMGRVFLARDPNIERQIALKVLMPERLTGAGGNELRQRFLQEARAAGGLSHRGIVTIYDADTDPDSGCPYLAMEWVPGCSLKSLLRREGPLAPERAVAMAAQVARALDYAHRRKIVHRDVKPGNLLVTDDRIKVVDFGIAKLVSKSLTQPGRVLGSPYYMAPEQVRGLEVDGRADLFSLGAVLYECLTGRAAFSGESVANVIHKLLTADPRPVELGQPESPPSLRMVVRRSLEKLPQNRYRSGAEMAAALETVGAELALGHRPGGLLPAAASETTTQLMSERANAGLADGAGRPRPATAAGRWRWPRLLALAGLVLIAGSLVGRSTDPQILDTADRGGESEGGPAGGPGLAAVRQAPAREGAGAERIPEAGAAGDRDAAVDAAEAAVPGGELPEAAVALAGGFGALPPDPALIDGQEAPSPIDPAGAVNSVDDSGIGEDIPSRLEPPADGPMPAGVQAAVATTDLEIVHQNRLKLATLSVWIDGRSALSVKLEAKSPLQRIKGREHRWLIPVPAGRHAVEVRVSGVSKELEASHEVWWVFSEEDPQRLTVKLWPESRQLGLQWESR